nr:MAG TPA: hypothetical protein [Caudoviricetes sp.]
MSIQLSFNFFTAENQKSFLIKNAFSPFGSEIFMIIFLLV